LRKPFTPDLLLETIRRCVANASKDDTNRSPHREPQSSEGGEAGLDFRGRSD
jgi:DNA-binding NtrC family response regulator